MRSETSSGEDGRLRRATRYGGVQEGTPGSNFSPLSTNDPNPPVESDPTCDNLTIVPGVEIRPSRSGAFFSTRSFRPLAALKGIRR